MIADGMARAVHDCSDGGILVALAEMALASGLGVEIEDDYAFGRGTAFFFGEDQARYIVEIDPADFADFQNSAKRSGIDVCHFGFVGGDAIRLEDPGRDGGISFSVSLADLRAAHEGFFPRLMGAEGVLA